MKKFLTLALAVVMFLTISAFIACGGGGATESSNGGEVNPPVVDSASSTQPNSSSQAKPDSSSSSAKPDSSSSIGGDEPSITPLNTIEEVKYLIDKSPDGVDVCFEGVVVGFDSMGYAHVGDESGIIYVRAKHENLSLGAFVCITGKGIVYKGSSSYPEYTRQITDTGIDVQPASGEVPSVKQAQVLSESDLKTSSESEDIGREFHGNLVTVTGRVYVGATKYTYYLFDDEGVNMLAIHHYSKFFNNSTDASQNMFNALDGKKITITGIIYRYYTKEAIWTFQYVGESFEYEIVEEGGGEIEDEYCAHCGRVIVAGSDHSIKECGHSQCLIDITDNHSKCAGCGGYMCDGNDHEHGEEQTVAQIKTLIDQNPNGIMVEFKGVVIGIDTLDYMHIADESGAIYVRASSNKYNANVGDYVQVRGKGQVYKGSATYPEYTRQIVDNSDYDTIQITQLDEEMKSVIEPVVLSSSDLKTTNESADICKSFHGNPVQITGTVSVGADKYSYYLLDDEGNKLVGIHHYSQYFYNTTDDYRNSFNALDGQEVTLTGVIYRYYTKESIWTFQYVNSRIDPNYYDECDVNGVKYEISGDGTYAIAKEQVYGYFDQHVEILDEFKGLPVKEIARAAFSDKSELLSVKIPNSVTVIGERAFANCHYLREIIIGSAGGSQLNTIEYCAFENTAIKQITLPKSLKTIRSSVFSGCESLKTVYFEGEVNDWAQIEFEGSQSNPRCYASTIYFGGETIDEVVLSTGVTSISGYAFYNFSEITEVVIPDTVTEIGWCAFNGCNNITQITMPCIELTTGYSSQISVLFGAASDVPSALKTVTITSGEMLCYSYFKDCKSITTVNLPESITAIYSYAFSGCTSLSQVNIPANVTYIDEGAFNECKSLTKIKLPAKLETLGPRAFAGSGLTEVRIPFTTTYIYSYTFLDCENLKTLYIHGNVTGVGEYAFDSPIQTVYYTGGDDLGVLKNALPSSATVIKISSYTLQ